MSARPEVHAQWIGLDSQNKTDANTIFSINLRLPVKKSNDTFSRTIRNGNAQKWNTRTRNCSMCELRHNGIRGRFRLDNLQQKLAVIAPTGCHSRRRSLDSHEW
jgi:hypothetical protein